MSAHAMRMAQLAGVVASPPPELCPDCGRPAESFACKIRHVQLNTGAAKAAND